MFILHSGDVLSREKRSVQYTLNTTSDNQITTSNIHTVRGPQGRDGHDGIPGRDGRDGASGRQGKKGDYGLQGPTGPQCMHFKFDLHFHHEH